MCVQHVVAVEGVLVRQREHEKVRVLAKPVPLHDGAGQDLARAAIQECQHRRFQVGEIQRVLLGAAATDDGGFGCLRDHGLVDRQAQGRDSNDLVNLIVRADATGAGAIDRDRLIQCEPVGAPATAGAVDLVPAGEGERVLRPDLRHRAHVCRDPSSLGRRARIGRDHAVRDGQRQGCRGRAGDGEVGVVVRGAGDRNRLARCEPIRHPTAAGPRDRIAGAIPRERDRVGRADRDQPFRHEARIELASGELDRCGIPLLHRMRRGTANSEGWR